MKLKIKRMLIGILACTCLGTTIPAQAADSSEEQNTAAEYLREKGIMVGDDEGNMLLEQGLTRAQLATILARMTVNQEYLEKETAFYRKQCVFTDVPEWAKVYVGYCASNYLVTGYGNGLYGPGDPVTSAAACTVLLRCLDDVDTEWSYSTACQKAVELNLAPAEAVAEAEITRGNMAILICRTMARMGYDENASSSSTAGTPQSGPSDPLSEENPFIPQVGNVIRCSDGTDYTITDVSRWDANAFSAGPLGALPEATCDWEQLYQPEIPEAEVKHYSIDGREYLFMRNLYETRRMLYTLYNAMGDIPELWNGGKAVTRADGTPKVHIQLTVPEDVSAYPFWPWRDDQIKDSIAACPAGTVYMEAWDVYKDGVFQRTEYSIRIQ